MEQEKLKYDILPFNVMVVYIYVMSRRMMTKKKKKISISL